MQSNPDKTVGPFGEGWEKDGQYSFWAVYWGPFLRGPGLSFIQGILGLYTGSSLGTD